MKKVLVAGAALLIAGSMVSAASAEVTLSGDARVRYVGKSDYNVRYTPNADGSFSEDTNGYDDSFNSRIRVKFDAKAAGGAFMKARLRFDDYTWDGQGWGAASEIKNVWADYAYIGVPMGNVTFTGGRMPADFSKFFSYDQRPTRVKLDWKVDNLRLIGLIDINDEASSTISDDDWNDNDFKAYGLVGSMKINDDWSVKAYARYQDDQREFEDISVDVTIPDTATEFGGVTVPVGTTRPVLHDKSGFLGSIHAQGKIAMVGLEGEIAYKEADVLGRCYKSSDPNCDAGSDAWGWYLDGSMDFGAFQPSVMIGGTYDGYVADDDFGFIMVGAAEPITFMDVGNSIGDSFFAAFVARYAISDQFKIAGNLAYFNYDADVADRIADALEISGSATYVISEGADLTYKLGYLSPSYDGQLNALGVTDDGMFGHYLRMAIKF